MRSTTSRMSASTCTSESLVTRPERVADAKRVSTFRMGFSCTVVKTGALGDWSLPSREDKSNVKLPPESALDSQESAGHAPSIGKGVEDRIRHHSTQCSEPAGIWTRAISVSDQDRRDAIRPTAPKPNKAATAATAKGL